MTSCPNHTKIRALEESLTSPDSGDPPSGPFRIPLHHLRMPKSIPAGMNLVRIGAITDTLRNGGEVWEPALVRREGPDCWSITDGKHRYMASYVAGMPDLLCVEEV